MPQHFSSGEGISGAVAVVTGGAGSIGMATSVAFDREGAQVWILDLPSAESAFKESPLADRATFLPVDVSDAIAFKATIDQVLAQAGRLDIAVGCAGIAAGTAIEEITEGEFDQIVGVNLRGAFNLVQATTPTMIERGYGKVVLLGSVAGHQGGVKSGAHYTAAKAGVHGLSRWAAKNLGQHGVYVNAVAPGPVLTAMWAGLGGGAGDEDQPDFPLRRLGRPEDVAEAIVFLASPASNWITGITLDVNGGYYLG